jgi:hypothetical protein
MTSQEEVLAHLGEALLSAQIVERFVGFTLSAEPIQKGGAPLDLFLARSWLERSAHLRDILAALDGDRWDVPKLDSELRLFQDRRNKLVHCFQTLGEWDFRKPEDCHGCVTFLRDFIDHSAEIQHLFFSVLSIRDMQFRTCVPESEKNQYAKDYKKVYLPLTVRWTNRIVA